MVTPSITCNTRYYLCADNPSRLILLGIHVITAMFQWYYRGLQVLIFFLLHCNHFYRFLTFDYQHGFWEFFS